jgi:hypothetical protein
MSQAQTADPIPEAPADEEVEGVAVDCVRELRKHLRDSPVANIWLDTIVAALRRSTATDKPGVREAALEEAAKVAETITQDGDYDLEPEATVAASVAGKQIAATIRALRTPPASPTEAGEATTSLPDPALTDAIEWLETNQRQLDQDGIEVAVSRQALEQVLAALKDRSHV